MTNCTTSSLSKIIFDFDGVICKNKKLYREVNRRSIEFVSHKTQFSFNEAQHFNNTNYKGFGHTVNMLKSYGVQTDLKEYNDYVFNDSMWYYVSKTLTDTDTFNILSIKAFNTLINDKSILFSNAPYIWCDHIVSMCGFNTNDLFDDIYTCDINDEDLKPQPKLYDEIDSKYKDFDLYFLDDNKNNLDCAPLHWNTLHVKDHDNLGEILLCIASDIHTKQHYCRVLE